MNNFDQLHLLVSSAIFGIIWIVQLLLYPNFGNLDQETFKQSMQHHQGRISIVIIPLMVTELALSVLSVVNIQSSINITVLSIVCLIWLLTFTVHVPLHTRLLENGFNKEIIDRLVLTNWSRTILWTINLLIVFSTTIHTL